MNGASYFDFTTMANKLFYGVGLTEQQWIDAVEQIESYFVSTGETDVLVYLGVGFERRLRNGRVIQARMKYFSGLNEGRKLQPYEICNLAMFLPFGPNRHEIVQYRSAVQKRGKHSA